MPVMEQQGLVRRAVLEVELAARVAERAREGAAAEERRDERTGVTDARGIAGRVRVERAAGDGAREIAAELSFDPGRHEVAVLAYGVTRARALAGQRDER